MTATVIPMPLRRPGQERPMPTQGYGHCLNTHRICWLVKVESRDENGMLYGRSAAK